MLAKFVAKVWRLRAKFFASIYLKILFILARTRCQTGTDTYMYILYIYLLYMYECVNCMCILEAAAGARLFALD